MALCLPCGREHLCGFSLKNFICVLLPSSFPVILILTGHSSVTSGELLTLSVPHFPCM